jgi:hypothetical protein
MLLPAAAAACGPDPKPGGSRTGADETDEVEKVVAKASRAAVTSFASKEEIARFLKEYAEANKEAQRRSAEEAAKAPAPAATAAADSPAEAESITNNQTAGVDEGGIVKVHGDHLVILRRGRLFTVRVGDASLTPVVSTDAFGPDTDPQGAWYDEMLVHKDRIIVIGYSYKGGGTEVGLFDIDREGQIRYRSTYHLKSNDYYSSRNYASRVVGGKLVFYTPLYVNPWASDPMESFPAVRRWHKGAKDTEFVSIVEPARVYRPVEPSSQLALHTVTSCDLDKPELQCSATAAMGPPGRVFYVSTDSVYVWMTPWSQKRQKSGTSDGSLLYKMPLDGSEPGVVRVKGAPIDQFSFLEGSDKHLNVVVRAEGNGEAMWSPEVTSGDVALLRIPTKLFDREARSAPEGFYTKLPKPSGWTFQNRFVGDYLFYGTGESWGRPAAKEEGYVVAHRYASDEAPTKIHLGVDRIEIMGKDALVVGADQSDLHFTAIKLGDDPAIGGRYVRKGASQGELRSHGFFYKPDGERSGVFGLPIREAGAAGSAHLLHGSASILFVKNESLDMRDIGSLAAREAGVEDGCKASCVDWYGNARPVFLRGRIFALMGYELVEGKIADGRIDEVGRVSFAPRR